MAITKDLTHLPTPARTRTDGCPPDQTPRFAHLLAEHWAEENAERDAAYQRRTRFHLSDAGKCSRAVAYAALEVPKSDPMDLSGVHNTRLGQMIHDAWQAAVAARWPDAEIEPRQLVLDGDGSGYSDLLVRHNDRRVIVELKSIGGFAFKQAVGERSAPKGPKHGHRLQGAMNARAADADELVIAYISKEAISVAAAARKMIPELGRFLAEWTFDRAEIEAMADTEEARIRGILDLLDDGQLPARKIPDPELPTGAVIIDPATGQWRQHGQHGEVLDAGSWWECGYCAWQTLCAGTDPGRAGIGQVVEVDGTPPRHERGAA